jgi:hypothetical protein
MTPVPGRVSRRMKAIAIIAVLVGGDLGEAMNTIVTAVIAAFGWSGSPVSAPYGFVEVGHVTVVSDRLKVEVSEMAPYAPHSLTCQYSSQTVAVPTADGGTRQITVNRC